MNIVTIYAFGSVIIVSLISLIGVFALSLNQKFLNKSVFLLVSLAVGALFGDAIIHLIPEAFEGIANPASASLLILSGILTFLVLEKFLRWRHAHGHECDTQECQHGIAAQDIKTKPVGSLIVASDSVHNLVDGIIIGVSYLISIEIGIATTLAIILHEIPQEISDFALLLHAGFSKVKALLLNFFSSLFAVVGVGIAFMFGSNSETFVPAIIAFAAGGFLYIAGSDLVPELHKTSDLKKSFQQFIAIILGIAIMFALLAFEM
jgi:zinc and cadmium transporter